MTVPPILPCFACEFCEQGHYSLCKNYKYFGSRNDGAFAQYLAVPETNLLKVADNVSFEAAATADPLANALHAVKRGGFQPGTQGVRIRRWRNRALCDPVYEGERRQSVVVAVDVDDQKTGVCQENCGADYHD